LLTHQHIVASAPTRVVVIGAQGFVGSTIVAQLDDAEVPRVAIGRHDIDLLLSDAAERLEKHLQPLDSVVFVSAVAPAKTAAQLVVNLRMAEAACRAFKAVTPAHLLYISSDAVYADDANPVTERSAVAPSTMHGMMHAARELMFCTEYRGPFATLRPTLIYGANDPHGGYGPNRFRRQAAKGEAITVFGEGEEKRDHIAVEDVAQLALRILNHGSTGALNAATGISTPFIDIAHLVASQFPSTAQVRSVARPGPRPHLLHRFFDITNTHKAFPDFRFVPLGAGITQMHRTVAI